VPGATVFVDGTVIGKTPMRDPVIVSMGRRKISAISEGRPPVIQNMNLAGAEVATVDLSFASASSQDPLAASASASSSPAQSAWSSSAVPSASAATPPRITQYDTSPLFDAPRTRVPSWPFWAVAGGLATASSILGIAALRSASNLEHGRNTLGTSRQSLDETRSEAAHLALATDIAAGAAIVCGGLGLYLSLTNRASSHWTSHQAKDGRTSLGIEMRPGSLQLRGAF
jgi:hypothetical protein